MANDPTMLSVILRTRDIFSSAGKNASVLSALKDAAKQLGWRDTLTIKRLFRDAVSEDDGADWRIKMLDRTIYRAAPTETPRAQEP